MYINTGLYQPFANLSVLQTWDYIPVILNSKTGILITNLLVHVMVSYLKYEHLLIYSTRTLHSNWRLKIPIWPVWRTLWCGFLSIYVNFRIYLLFFYQETSCCPTVKNMLFTVECSSSGLCFIHCWNNDLHDVVHNYPENITRVNEKASNFT